MRISKILAVASLPFSAAPALAELTIKSAGDGSYIIEGDMSEIGAVVGTSIDTATNFGLAMAKIHGGTQTDYTEGHVIDQSVLISIARTNGSVGTYTVDGPIFAYDSQNTFTETSANYSLTGVACSEMPMGASSRTRELFHL